MSTHLSEDEQLQALKRWWRQYGNSTLTAVLLVLVLYSGWQWWQKHTAAQNQNASLVFQQLSDVMTSAQGRAMTDEQLLQASSLGEQIKSNYEGSFYATSAALLMAKMAVETDDLAAAKDQLLWAQSHNSDEVLAPVIDLRLARVQFALGDTDAAMALVADVSMEEYTSAYAEVRGDILASSGDASGARQAYQVALDTLPSEQSNRRLFIEMKRDQYATGSEAEAS